MSVLFCFLEKLLIFSVVFLVASECWVDDDGDGDDDDDDDGGRGGVGYDGFPTGGGDCTVELVRVRMCVRALPACICAFLNAHTCTAVLLFSATCYCGFFNSMATWVLKTNKQRNKQQNSKRVSKH